MEIPHVVYTLLEWSAFLTGLIYIFYAARNDYRCWYWGIFSCAAWMFVTVNVYDLYADGALQFFYVVMGFIGLYQWRKGGNGEELPISHLNWTQRLGIAFGGLLLSFAGGYFLSQYTEAMATYVDSGTTVFSIIATVLLIQKKTESWPLWVVVNSAYIGLYLSRDATLFALLFVVYNILAIYGWYNWRKEGFEN